MASRRKIVLTLGAADGVADRRAPLDDFTNVCGALRNCLRHVARCLDKEGVRFAVSDLKFSSACIEAEPLNGQGEDVVRLFDDTIEALETGRPIDDRLDYSALHCFNGFCGAIKNRRLRLQIEDFSLTNHYVANLSSLLEGTSPEEGSVSGRLEAFDLHRKSRFFLYPPAYGEEIECSFEIDTLDEVLRAVTKQVTVFGTLHYASSKIFPVRVDVHHFVVESSDDQLPDLISQRGAWHKANKSRPEVKGGDADGWK